MAESTGLLNLRRGNSTEGSNPSLSAIILPKKMTKDRYSSEVKLRFFLFTKMNPLWFDDEVEHERSESNPSLSAILSRNRA